MLNSFLWGATFAAGGFSFLDVMEVFVEPRVSCSESDVSRGMWLGDLKDMVSIRMSGEMCIVFGCERESWGFLPGFYPAGF